MLLPRDSSRNPTNTGEDPNTDAVHTADQERSSALSSSVWAPTVLLGISSPRYFTLAFGVSHSSSIGPFLFKIVRCYPLPVLSPRRIMKFEISGTLGLEMKADWDVILQRNVPHITTI